MSSSIFMNKNTKPFCLWNCPKVLHNFSQWFLDNNTDGAAVASTYRPSHNATAG
jgi:hypothetical protein